LETSQTADLRPKIRIRGIGVSDCSKGLPKGAADKTGQHLRLALRRLDAFKKDEPEEQRPPRKEEEEEEEEDTN
jgi:hypothetical protein